MHNIYLSYNAIISALGFNSAEVITNIENGKSGIALIDNKTLFDKPFYTSIIDKKRLQTKSKALKIDANYTVLEQMMILALQDVLSASKLKLDTDVGIVISTTKGNINVLDANSKFPKSYSYLSRLSKAIKQYFSIKTEPIIVSNACVSGVLAISVAKRLILENKYKHVLVVSGDVVTKFVLSGFNAFKAMSNLPCKPYSKNRSGINLGEASACVLVTSDKTYCNAEGVQLIGDSTCNDANHISGPSRTGEGLFRSVSNAMKEAKITSKNIDYISAHGTATDFNDEMEAIAFNRLELQDTPLHSLKGYFGHTLGSSGLVETIVGMHSLKQNKLYKSEGFTSLGVSQPLKIIEKTAPKKLNCFLKTASGFGGANTALILKKINNS